MNMNKEVNINVKIKLSRVPSKKEKRKLVEMIANVLDSSEPHQGLYGFDFRENDVLDNLDVKHHYVTERKTSKK